MPHEIDVSQRFGKVQINIIRITKKGRAALIDKASKAAAEYYGLLASRGRRSR
jgi:hypothetical protein